MSREKNTLVAGGVVHTAAFQNSRNKEEVQNELRDALEVFVKNDVDLIIVEVQ